MSPITDYDLGRARGHIVIDYDDRGTQQAQESFSELEQLVDDLIGMFHKLASAARSFATDFGDNAKRIVSFTGLLAGGAAILLGFSRSIGFLTRSSLQLRGVMGIFGSLGLLLGGLPRSVQGFPRIIKQIITLSAAITLFTNLTPLISRVIVQIGRLIGSTAIIRRFAAAFPFLANGMKAVAGFIPSLTTIGKTINGWSRPIHVIANMALSLGALIAFFRTGTKAALALTRGILKLGAGAAVIQGLILLVAGLGDAVTQLSGLLGLIPGALSVIGVSAAAVTIGLQGFSDALKNMGDDAKFEEALKNLAPNAQAAAREIRGLRDNWDRLRRAVQDRLFAGSAEEIRDLARIWMPLLQTRLGNVASLLNGMAKEVSNFFKQVSTIQDVNLIFDAIEQTLTNLRPLVQPILSILMDIFVVSAQVFAEFSGQLNSATIGFAKFIHEARESGALADWIRNGVAGLKSLIEIIWSIGQIFNIVFDAFDSNSDGFLASVEAMTQQIKIFLMSAEGQEILQTFVDLLQTLSSVTQAVLGAGISELGPIIKALLPFLKEMATTISAVLVVAIKILGPILEAVASTLSAMAPVLGPLVGFFLAWSITMSALSAGIGLLVTVLGTLITAIGSVIKVIRVLFFLVSTFPLTAIVIAIAALAWIIVENWDKIAPALKATWEWIKSVAETVWGAISDFFVRTWNSIASFFTRIWNDIVSDAKAIWDGVSNFFVEIWEDIERTTKAIWNSISGFLEDSWNWLVETFRFIWEPLVDIAKSIAQIIYDVLTIIFGGLAIVLIAIWNGIVAGVTAAWNWILGHLKRIWGEILMTFHAFWDPISGFFQMIWDAVVAGVTTAWNWILAELTRIWGEIVVTFHAIWDPIAGAFQAVWDAISTGVSNTWNAIVNFIKTTWTGVTNWWRENIQPWVTAISDVWNRINDAVKRGVNNVVDWVRGLPGRIWDLVKDAGRWLWNAGKAVITGFLNGLKDAFRAVRDWVGGVADWVRNNKGPLEKDRRLLIPAGEAIMLGLLQGLQSKQSIIESFLGGLTTDIQNGLGSANVALSNSANSLAASATLGIVSSFPSNAEALASSVTPLQGPANGISRAAEVGAPATASITIGTLELHIAGNLDPTNPAAWNEAIKNIKEGIRRVERGYPNG